MQSDDLTVRVQVLDGVWETFGVDRAIHVVPESLVASTNEWGNDRASFDLRRDPAVGWPDLQAFSPVEVEIAGDVVWTGRVLETPARDGADAVINVQCEGWQYHLDDDVFAKNYVHTNLNDWKDHRSLPSADLVGAFLASQLVQADGGVITIGTIQDTVWAGSRGVGVTLDLGPNATAKRIVVGVKRGPGSPASVNFYARGHTAEGSVFTGTVYDAFTTAIASISQAGTTLAGTFSTATRYVTLFLYRGGATYTATNDDIVTITSVQIFSDAAHESANASILKASQVVSSARAQATPLLSSDVSRIATTAFSIPDLHFETTPRSPREVISGVNAFHNYLTYVDTDKRLVFQPRPTAPLFEVGAFGNSSFEDSAMNSGQDVYNRVVVTGTGPDGNSILLTRTTYDTATNLLIAVAPQLPNNGFETNLSGWVFTGAGLVSSRVTTQFHSGVASAECSGETVGSTADAAITGTFLAGVTYRLSAWVRADTSNSTMNVTFGTTSADNQTSVDVPAFGTAWQQITVDWSPTATTSAAVASFRFSKNGRSYYLDDVYVLRPALTIVDRSMFMRTKVLPVGASLTTAVATQIGDTYLTAHKTQPLRGAITATSADVRNVLSGKAVHPSHILREVGQLVRLAHRVDPDTGALGRDGQIASVTYTHARREARIELDSDRRNFEALLARFESLSVR